jgi:hypothetical protein
VGEREQILLDRQSDVEVAELRGHPELGSCLLRLVRELVPEHLEVTLSAIDCAVSSRIVVDFAAPLGPRKPTQVDRHVEVQPVDGGNRAVALDDAAQPDRELLFHALSPPERLADSEITVSQW